MKASIKTLILGGLVVVGAVLCGAPARAAAPARAVLADWLAQNTDLPATEVAIAGPDNVYALETLGAPEPTGEVVALVRTESLSPAWGAAHGFRSWDSHVLIDCRGGRMRVIRSAGYAEPNRQGAARAETPDLAWFTPRAGQPAATLLAAACDPAFAWPMRSPAVPDAPADPPAREVAAAAPAPSASATPSAPRSAARFAIQLARGPWADGAARVLRRTRALLGPAAQGLSSVTEASRAGRRARYTARLEGFDSAAQAAAACQALIRDGQACLVRHARGLASQRIAARGVGSGPPGERALARRAVLASAPAAPPSEAHLLPRGGLSRASVAAHQRAQTRPSGSSGTI